MADSKWLVEGHCVVENTYFEPYYTYYTVHTELHGILDTVGGGHIIPYNMYSV